MSGLSLGFLVKGCCYLRAAILVGPLAGNVEPHGSRSLGGRNQSVCLAFIPFRSHLPDFDESEVWLSSAHSSGPHTWAQVLEICHFPLNVSGWGLGPVSRPLLGIPLLRHLCLAVTDSQRECGGQGGVFLQKAGHFQQSHRPG